jgi:hypothetical protein
VVRLRAFIANLFAGCAPSLYILWLTIGWRLHIANAGMMVCGGEGNAYRAFYYGLHLLIREAGIGCRVRPGGR